MQSAAADPQTKPPDLGCQTTCRLLSSTTTIAIYYYYSARKLILFNVPRRVEGRVDLSTARRVHTAHACKSQWFYDKHNCPQRDSIPGPRALQSGMLPLDHCDLQTYFTLLDLTNQRLAQLRSISVPYIRAFWREKQQSRNHVEWVYAAIVRRTANAHSLLSRTNRNRTPNNNIT